MLRNHNFYDMKSAFFVTLLRNNDPSENHIISPEYKDIENAATFLDEVITRLDGPRVNFKMLDDAGLIYQDPDYTFQVVEEKAYKGIPLTLFEEAVFETCYEHLRDFMVSELAGKE